MIPYYLYIILCTPLIVVNCEEMPQIQKDNKCIFNNDNSKTSAFKLLSKMLPPTLDGKSKGEAGKIGVIGGSIEYTGAPYFAAITALRAGADLAYVITTESASPVIKAYSPDLIVYPFLNIKTASKIRSLLSKMSVIVIGPGLGRDSDTMSLVYDIIEDCKRLRKPLVIDADGIYAVSKNSSVLIDYPCPGVIMTPNKREANKLMESVSSNSSNWYMNWGNCVAVLVKGETDYFYSSTLPYCWGATGAGSGRRAAGQGDMLTGALATYFGWALNTEFCKNENNTLLAQSVASYAAAKLTRLCNYKAFQLQGRNMIGSDMISQIHYAFDDFIKY